MDGAAVLPDAKAAPAHRAAGPVPSGNASASCQQHGSADSDAVAGDLGTATSPAPDAAVASGAGPGAGAGAGDGDAPRVQLHTLPWDCLLRVYEFLPSIYVSRSVGRVCTGLQRSTRQRPAFAIDLPRVRAVLPNGQPAPPVKVCSPRFPALAAASMTCVRVGCAS